MKNLLFILILSSPGINYTFAQTENEELNEFSGLNPETIELIDEAAGTETDSGTVILLREAKMIVGEGGLCTISYHIVGQIFDADAKEDYSQIPVPFNSYYDNVTLDFARTIDKDKTFIEVSKDAVQIKTSPDYYGLNTYTDSKILAFSLPALKPGKFFEYQITFSSKLPIVSNYWFESFSFNQILRSLSDPYFIRIDPVNTSRFILTVPENECFQSEIINTEFVEDKTVDRGFETYTWEVENLPSITLESGMPYLYEVIPFITVSSILDWKAFGSWVYSIINQSVSVSNDLKMKATELTANAVTKNEKIKILYDYVREEIDYIQADLDRGGLKPHSADDVLRNKYGDCKDQVALLLSLLQSVNIEAFPALINTYSFRNHKEFLPTQYFDHLIVFVPGDSVDIWLDSTTEINEFPSLYVGNQNRWTLVLDEKGGKFLKTPSAPAKKNIGILNLVMNSESDSLKGTIVVKSYGAFKDNLSSFFAYYSKADQDNYFRNIVESYYYQVAGVKEINSSEGLTNSESHTQNISFNYLQPTNEYTLFSYTSSIPLAFAFFYIELPFDEERVFDYRFPCKFLLKGRESLQTPWKHASIKNVPVSNSIFNKYFTFNQLFEQYEDSVLVNWEFALKEDYILKEDYNSFYSDVIKVEEMLGWQIDFQKQLDYSKDILSLFASYMGIDVDSTMFDKEFIPPRYLSSLSINSSIQKQISSVIVEYIDAINEGDDIRALNSLHKDNAERRSINRGLGRKLKSMGISMKIENITLIDLVYDYAIVTFTTIMEMKKNPEIGPIRFENLSILNKSDSHWKIFRSFVKNYADNCTLYSLLAYLYYNDKDYDKALVIYDLSMANDSTCTTAFGSTGWIYYLKGNYQKCIEYSQKAVELDSTALYAQYNIALSYLCLGDFDRAKSKYEQTIQLNKDLEEDIHQGAIEDLQNLIKDNFKKNEAETILTELFEVKDINKSVPAKAK